MSIFFIKAPWHVAFRLTHNNPFSDCSSLGDRTLAAWVGNGFVHFATYYYDNLLG